MISEGVDIKRLRVLAYLPNALTELAFRQAVGRVVRNMGPKDDTRAYVVMPKFETLDVYARRIEREMPSSRRKDEPAPREKICPVCGEKSSLQAIAPIVITNSREDRALLFHAASAGHSTLLAQNNARFVERNLVQILSLLWIKR